MIQPSADQRANRRADCEEMAGRAVEGEAAKETCRPPSVRARALAGAECPCGAADTARGGAGEGESGGRLPPPFLLPVLRGLRGEAGACAAPWPPTVDGARAGDGEVDGDGEGDAAAAADGVSPSAASRTDGLYESTSRVMR